MHPSQLERNLWQPSAALLRGYRGTGRCAVTIRITPASALDPAWRALAAERAGRAGGAGAAGAASGAGGAAIPDGGAVLHRVGDAEVRVESGGEDGLDSLQWAINDTLGGHLHAVAAGATVQQVHEEWHRRSS